MLDQDRNKIVAVILFIIVLLTSCKDNNEKEKQLESNCEKISITTIGGENIYRQVFHNLYDTLKIWEFNHIAGFKSGNCDYSSYRVDSLMCFNNSKNKMITSLLESSCKQDKGDGIHFFYGVKINERWYFFRGAYIFLPRELYEDNVSKPLSFEQLHEIAMKEVFSGYLIQKQKDAGFWKNNFSPEYEYVINDKFFDQMESKNRDGTYGPGLKTFEECVMYQVNINWQKK